MIRTALFLFSLVLSGCSSIFFYPMEKQILTPDRLGLEYQDIRLKTEDNLSLHGWFLPAKGEPKGTIYFLHGNAENISTHIQSVYWLPEMGYQVFLIDYRGFGLSEGVADLPSTLEDIQMGFNWVVQQESVSGKPVYLFGQSLGASMGLYFVATDEQARNKLSAVISDASFTRYRDIARYVASQTWLTWPFQYPASWMMIRGHDPIDFIADISPLPLLLIHSKDDDIIPFIYSDALFDAALEPKSRLVTTGRHGATFNQPKNRWALLRFLEKAAK